MPKPEQGGKRGDTSKHKIGVSRREFARRAAIAAAGAAALPGALVAQLHAATQFPQQAGGTPKLSTEAREEVEQRFQAILRKYEHRFSDSQKTELRRLCEQLQPSLDSLRAFPLANGDQPATILKLYTEPRQPRAGRPKRGAR